MVLIPFLSSAQNLLRCRFFKASANHMVLFLGCPSLVNGIKSVYISWVRINITLESANFSIKFPPPVFEKASSFISTSGTHKVKA
jgi:hypothetical protein